MAPLNVLSVAMTMTGFIVDRKQMLISTSDGMPRKLVRSIVRHSYQFGMCAVGS